MKEIRLDLKSTSIEKSMESFNNVEKYIGNDFNMKKYIIDTLLQIQPVSMACKIQALTPIIRYINKDFNTYKEYGVVRMLKEVLELRNTINENEDDLGYKIPVMCEYEPTRIIVDNFMTMVRDIGSISTEYHHYSISRTGISDVVNRSDIIKLSDGTYNKYSNFQPLLDISMYDVIYEDIDISGYVYIKYTTEYANGQGFYSIKEIEKILNK